MTDSDILYKGLSKAAWGYVFVSFDINFGTVSILPQFVGFLLLLSAVRLLAEERKDLLLLRPLCQLLAGYHLADWLLSWCGTSLDGRYMFLDLLVVAAGLYFHFQFLTDMAALAERVKRPGMMLDGSIRMRRNAYVVLETVLSLLGYILPGEKMVETLAGEVVPLLPLGIAGFIVAILVMSIPFDLRRCLKNAPREYCD